MAVSQINTHSATKCTKECAGDLFFYMYIGRLFKNPFEFGTQPNSPQNFSRFPKKYAYPRMIWVYYAFKQLHLTEFIHIKCKYNSLKADQCQTLKK